jgi:DNA-binding NarL/FixJ family response regulator
MARIRVLLAEDHVVLRDGLKALVATEPDIEIVAEAGSGQEACQKTLQFDPDVVVMDLSLPELNGIDATTRILRERPHARVVILSMYDNEEYVFQALRAGASGYVLKQSNSSELLAAIRAAYSGGSFLSLNFSHYYR